MEIGLINFTESFDENIKSECLQLSICRSVSLETVETLGLGPVFHRMTYVNNNHSNLLSPWGQELAFTSNMGNRLEIPQRPDLGSRTLVVLSIFKTKWTEKGFCSSSPMRILFRASEILTLKIFTDGSAVQICNTFFSLYFGRVINETKSMYSFVHTLCVINSLQLHLHPIPEFF